MIELIIEVAQTLLNLFTGSDLKVDGHYGDKTWKVARKLTPAQEAQLIAILNFTLEKKGAKRYRTYRDFESAVARVNGVPDSKGNAAPKNVKVVNAQFTSKLHKNFGWLSSPLGRSISVSSSINPKRKHPTLNVVRPHKGTDFRAKVGTPVYAVADGFASKHYQRKGAGHYIKINHKNGYRTVYMHLSQVVKTGQVEAGDLIGYSGQSGGVSSGPHLHFEVRKNNAYYDPFTGVRYG